MNPKGEDENNTGYLRRNSKVLAAPLIFTQSSIAGDLHRETHQYPIHSPFISSVQRVGLCLSNCIPNSSTRDTGRCCRLEVTPQQRSEDRCGFFVAKSRARAGDTSSD